METFDTPLTIWKSEQFKDDPGWWAIIQAVKLGNIINFDHIMRMDYLLV